MGALLSFLGIVPAVLHTVDGIEAAISNEKIAAITATTEQERIRSQERINTLQARRDVLIAEAAKSPWNARVRGLIAIPSIAILWKLELWDKVVAPFFGCVGHTEEGTCGIFTTDALDAHQWYAITAVICFYLVADAYRGK
jgi:hypothetical protein